MKSAYKIVLLILIMFYVFILPAFADDIEWVDPQEKTLRLAESFTRDGFLIEASDFYNSTALITVYDADHRLISRSIAQINDSWAINDKLNITIKDLQEISGNISASSGLNMVVDQWVKIQTRVAGQPALKISIIPRERQINNITVVDRVFVPDSEIPINFSIKNDGKATLRDLHLKINSSLPLLFSDDKLSYELPDITAGNESETITVRFNAPYIVTRTPFTISAEAKGKDIFGNEYQAADSTYVEVRPQVEKIIDLKKYVSEKVYIGDITVVSLSIKNNGSQAIRGVNLFDDVPSGLEPLDTNLTWNFTLEPNENKLISYKIKPKKPGIYFFPAASSRVEYSGGVEYNLKSNKLIVNGPYVVLTKSASNDNPVKGDTVNITVEARNIGDATAIVKLRDFIPLNYSLGLDKEPNITITNTMVLHPDSSVSFSYILNTTEAGDFILPSADAVVLDQFLYQNERYTQRSISNNLTINVNEPLTSVITPVSTPIQKVTTRSNVAPVGSETPAQVSKTAAGSYGYLFFVMLLLVTWLIKKKDFKR